MAGGKTKLDFADHAPLWTADRLTIRNGDPVEYSRHTTKGTLLALQRSFYGHLMQSGVS